MTRPFQHSTFCSRINSEINNLVAFGSIPAAFANLINVGTDQYSTTLMYYNSTDVEITLKLVESGVEIPVPAGLGITQYPFPHNGVIQYKYASGAPSSGAFLIKSF